MVCGLISLVAAAEQHETGRASVRCERPSIGGRHCLNSSSTSAIKNLERDREGLDLPDLDAAYMEAFEAAKEMWIEAIRDMRNPMRQSFEVADAAGNILIVVPFGEVLASLKGVPNQHPAETAHRAAELTSEVRQAVATAYHRLSEAQSLLAQLPVR
jgi:hypothetical protein